MLALALVLANIKKLTKTLDNKGKLVYNLYLSGGIYAGVVQW